ncbi:hypothetical protein SCRES3_gp72 [Synechococcus phage S-CRES3]|nr:hypothetical protein SCRES3_gp72 [Synechococcus phage S-CRES3]
MPTVKHQAWTSATWVWDTAAADGGCTQVLDELRSWITAVNLNASQSGKPVALLRDETSSTTTNFRGWTIEFAQPGHATEKMYHQWFSASTTICQSYFGDTFTDDTSRGGYGTVNTVDADTSVSFLVTGVTTSFDSYIAYDTTDGQEFFVWGWWADASTTRSDWLGYFKDQNGNWMAIQMDGASTNMGAFDPVKATPGMNQQSAWNRGTTGLSNALFQATWWGGGNPAGMLAGDTFTLQYVINNPNVLQSTSTATPGSYITVNGSSDQYIRVGYEGPWVRYTPV